MARDGSGAPAVSSEVQRLLQEALEGEDERLLALERRLGQLQAERSRAASRSAVPAPASPATASPATASSPPPPADQVTDLDEARQLVAESGRYLRELERSIQALEGRAPASPEPPPPAPVAARSAGLAPPPAPATTPALGQPASAALPEAPDPWSGGWDRPAAPVREGSSSQARPTDPSRHELGRVFAPGSHAAAAGEPAWARAMVSAQERTLAALERVAESLQGAREAEAAALEERLLALESALAAASAPPVEAPTAFVPPAAALGGGGSAAATAAAAAPAPAPVVPPPLTSSAALRARLQASPAPASPARVALSEALRRAPPAQPAAPPPPEPAAVLRAGLLELAGEHQALVAAQVRLLERLLHLLEP